MKRIILIMILLGTGCIAGRLSTDTQTLAQDPCGSHFQFGTYLEDFEVIQTVEHHRMTVNEILEMLDRQPNVRTVSVQNRPPRRYFDVETLAYPQYADRYELTATEWADLQAYVREKLKDPIAADSVIAHWRSIAAGVPPFGLKVEKTTDVK